MEGWDVLINSSTIISSIFSLSERGRSKNFQTFLINAKRSPSSSPNSKKTSRSVTRIRSQAHLKLRLSNALMSLCKPVRNDWMQPIQNCDKSSSSSTQFARRSAWPWPKKIVTGRSSRSSTASVRIMESLLIHLMLINFLLIWKLLNWQALSTVASIQLG